MSLIQRALFKKDGTPRVISFLNVVGIIGVLYLVPLTFIRTDFSGPWWQWNYEGVHHFWDFLIMPLVGLFLIFIVKVKGYTAALGVWFVLSLHELLWYGTFLIMSIMSHQYFRATIGGNLGYGDIVGTTLQLAQLFGVGIIILLGRLPGRYFALMIAAYAVWFMLGFHIRTGYGIGETQWYNDPLTNIEEIASWVVAGLGFCLLMREDMKEVDERLSYVMLAIFNLVIKRLSKTDRYGPYQLAEQAQGKEEERNRGPGNRDSRRVHLGDLCPRSGDHEPIYNCHDSVAGWSRSDIASGPSGLRWNSHPPRHLQESKDLGRRPQ